MMHAQRTLQREVVFHGIGLHSGQKVTVRMVPTASDSGIVFVRTDSTAATADAARIPALWSSVQDTRLCTRLANSAGVSVSTVEHLMAALAALEIDNVDIWVDGPELPIMDGSAAPFMALLREAGHRDLDRPRRWLRVLRPVEVHLAGRSAKLLPAETLSLQYTWLAEREGLLTGQSFQLADPATSFFDDVAAARTFGFLEDVEMLRRHGLALGGSLDNSVVIDGDRVLNPEGLRMDNECVRHKILDAMGDLYLAGAPLLARFEGQGSGHDLNVQLVTALMQDECAWEWSYSPAVPLSAPTIFDEGASGSHKSAKERRTTRAHPPAAAPFAFAAVAVPA